MEDMWLSREELLSRELNRNRRAAKLLSAIETRCLHMRDESRRVVAAFLLQEGLKGAGDFKRQFQGDYFQSFKLAAASRRALRLDHLEHFAPQTQSCALESSN